MSAMQKIGQVTSLGGQSEWLSALVDGEADEAAVDALFAANAVEGDLHSRWHCYQLMGDVMRNAGTSAPLRSAPSFLAGVMAGLPEAQSAPLRLDRVEAPLQLRAPAANDGVMRWKMLAGVASVAAVVAVSWGGLSGAPGAPGAPVGAQPGMQLASSSTEAQAAINQAQPVAVKTEQGTLIRDARLEQFLAEHRQYGGATALQMPAGFLRNATYEAAPQR